ncbi:hypothetical protein OSCI_3910021 [Kamptonema sp. PCC 6506]|nr:hypothetical protein OSCI_3910021 [Kamptonema sp. PCC 6506]
MVAEVGAYIIREPDVVISEFGECCHWSYGSHRARLNKFDNLNDSTERF